MPGPVSDEAPAACVGASPNGIVGGALDEDAEAPPPRESFTSSLAVSGSTSSNTRTILSTIVRSGIPPGGMNATDRGGSGHRRRAVGVDAG